MLVESREPQSIYLIIKKDSPDSKKEFFQVGDYLLVKGFSVERKKGRDFMGSLLSKRLFTQLNALCEYDHPILAIVTPNIWRDFYFTKSRYIHNVYKGFLATLTAKYPKVRLLQFADDEEFADFLVRLEKKLTEEAGKKERPKPAMRKPTSEQEVKENILCGIPGVGVPLSKKLLKKFSSINNISNTTEEELVSIDKLGKTTAKRILESLN